MAVVVTCDCCGGVMERDESPKFPLDFIQFEMPLRVAPKGYSQSKKVHCAIEAKLTFKDETNQSLYRWNMCQRCFDVEIIKAASKLAVEKLPLPILDSLKKTAANIL